MKTGLKVFAPATVANVACGYDLLGFALEKPGDEIIARLSDQPGLRITKIKGVGTKKLPFDIRKNTAGFAAQKLLEHLGETKIGIELEIYKKMPFGSGLGSSAASAVAGVMAVNEILRRPLTKRELLPFAVLGEQIADGAYHADNVAPSLLGGLIFIRDNETLDFHRIPVPKGLFATVVHPHIEVLTKDSRAVLKEEVSLDNFVTQSGNLGAFLLAMFTANMDLLARSLQDVIIEPQRASLIDGFYEVKEAALKAGALGCSISGSGPSIFALSNNSLIAEEIAHQMSSIFASKGIDYQIYQSGINLEGAVLL